MVEMPIPASTGQEQLSVTFGDATNLPVHITEATFQVFPLAAVRQNLVKLSLTVVNDSVPDSISAKLRMPLPLGATVCRFEFQRGAVWYPAVPVEAKKAKEVVYKEREKGRSVAAASEVQGSVFEIEVFPLAHNQPTECRLWYSHAEPSFPFRFGADTEVTVSGTPVGDRGGPAPCGPGAQACVGVCSGEKHFACYVPFEQAEASESPGRIVLVWDTSGSQNSDHALRFSRLAELSAQCPGVLFDLWTFNITYRKVKEGAPVEEVQQALEAEDHDGGTDLELLPRLLAEIDTASMVILFSDGMDSLGRCPTVTAPCPRVHCVVDRAPANLQALRRLSMATGGMLLTGGYGPVLRPQTLLARITTDQDTAAFCGDDAFQCCPDHRLQVRWPVELDGLWVCGVLGSVTRITLELEVGACTREVSFDMAGAADVGAEAAALLGFLYARQRYLAVEQDGAAMGVDLAQLRAELALRYGFCSPEASLLMLYEPGQFLENGIACPGDHPAFKPWQAEVAKAGPPGGSDPAKSPARGDIGQQKTDAQVDKVKALAARLKDYIKSPAAGTEPRKAMCRGPMLASVGCCSGAGDASDDGASDGSSPRLCGAKAHRRLCEAAFRDYGAAPPESPDLRAEPSSRERRLMMATAGGMSMKCKRGGSPGAGPGAAGRGTAQAAEAEAYVPGNEQGYLGALAAALESGSWLGTYVELRRDHGSSPSFYLYAASLILGHSKEAAARVCTNCLEVNLQDVQMMRCVGYFLIKAGRGDLALAVLNRIQDLAPVEPQSFLDGALARALHMSAWPDRADRSEEQRQRLSEAIELTAHAITHVWAERFLEVEWPALVLLHLLVELGEKQGLPDLWPPALDRELRCPDFELGLVVWLGWDTDKTDIDLHVVEPDGNEVYYSNPRSQLGGHLSKDFTQGYGPEVYLLKSPAEGEYRVRAKYFASHQQSALTGATSAVLWTLEGGERVQFETVRLDRDKEMIDVMTVKVAPARAGSA